MSKIATINNNKFSCVVFLLIFIAVNFSSANAIPPPRGQGDPLEAKRKARINKIKREKARRNSINCYLKERLKLSEGGFNCIYRCPSVKGRVESNSVGAGFSCPTMMNVLKR
jgi:hypothetical protein